MRNLFICILAGIVWPAFAAYAPDPSIHVLKEGTYYDEDLTYSVAAQQWFSVSGKEIKKVTVTLKNKLGQTQEDLHPPKPDPRNADPLAEETVVDVEPPAESYEKWELILKSTAMKDARFLIAGLKLKEGAIAARAYTGDDPAGFPLTVKIGEHSYSIKATVTNTKETVVYDSRPHTFSTDHHRLEITREGGPTLVQTGTSDPSGYGFSLLWIGDLNGDGFPDLFMNQNPGKGDILGVYLSNLKSKGFDFYVIPTMGC